MRGDAVRRRRSPSWEAEPPTGRTTQAQSFSGLVDGVTELTERQLIGRSIANPLQHNITEPAPEALAETRQNTIDQPINRPSLSTFPRPVAAIGGPSTNYHAFRPSRNEIHLNIAPDSKGL